MVEKIAVDGVDLGGLHFEHGLLAGATEAERAEGGARVEEERGLRGSDVELVVAQEVDIKDKHMPFFDRFAAYAEDERLGVTDIGNAVRSAVGIKRDHIICDGKELFRRAIAVLSQRALLDYGRGLSFSPLEYWDTCSHPSIEKERVVKGDLTTPLHESGRVGELAEHPRSRENGTSGELGDGRGGLVGAGHDSGGRHAGGGWWLVAAGKQGHEEMQKQVGRIRRQ